MNLAAEAQNARDVGTAFDRFLDALPDAYFTELTALVAELYAIGSALRDLDFVITSPEYGWRATIIQDDLDLVQLSLSITLKDARERFNGLDRDGYPPTVRAYREVWIEICRHFERESGNTLQTRLERFRQFIMELCCTMRRQPPDPREMERLRWSINTLVDAQTRRLDAVALGPQLGRRRSFLRLRGGAEPRSPPSPFFPRATEIPISPSVVSNSSHSSGSNSVTPHWAVTVFEQAQSATPFRASGQVSACQGPDMPDARSRLAQEYERLCELPFDNQDLVVYLYLRQEDLRARILCRSLRSNRSKLCCLPLSALKANRSESCIQLRKPNPLSGSLDLWANLRFTTYERMILFYCTFLALRSQDSGSPVRNIDDHELHGERELFAGKIYDDGYMHALRLYRDRDSKGLRIQASVLGGELKRFLSSPTSPFYTYRDTQTPDQIRTPIWTAFITHHIASTTWMRRHGRIIHLRELNRFIFSPDYKPQYGPRGEHELQFTAEQDALDFRNIIDDLVADS